MQGRSGTALIDQATDLCETHEGGATRVERKHNGRDTGNNQREEIATVVRDCNQADGRSHEHEEAAQHKSELRERLARRERRAQAALCPHGQVEV